MTEAAIDTTMLFFGAIWLTILGIAAYADLKTRLVSNRLSIALLFLWVTAVLVGQFPGVWLSSIAVATIVFAVSYTMWNLGLMGGADVKLLTCASLWTGVEHTMPFLFAVAMAGGLIAAVIMFSAARQSHVFKHFKSFIGFLTHRTYRLVCAMNGAVVAGPSCDSLSEASVRENDASRESKKRVPSVPYATAIALGGLWIWPTLFLF